MLVKHHIIVSLGGGAIVYLVTQSFFRAALFCLAGIFIDIDHFFDYIHTYGWKITDFRNFSEIFYAGKLKKIYVLFHSYELFAIFGFLLWYFKTGWGWVIFLSIAIHLFMDQLYYLTHFRPCSPWFYFLSYRISRGFRVKEVFMGLRGRHQKEA